MAETYNVNPENSPVMNVTLNASDRMYVYDGGTADETTINSSGRLIVSSGGTASNNYVSSGGRMHVSEGGLADGNHVFKSGWIIVSSGGKADHTVISSAGDLYVRSGGSADHTSLASSGRMGIDSGGTADRITLTSGGSLYVYSGATATNIDWTPGATVVLVNGGATATFVSSFTGVYLGSDGKVIESAPSMDGTVIAGHNMNVMEGGLATNATIDSGRLWVYSGGTANNVTLNEWDASLVVFSGGTADYTTVNSGTFELDGGTADHTAIYSGGRLYVYGGLASRTTIYSRAYLAVSSGGTADAVTIKYGGTLYVDAGATVTNVDWTPCVGNIYLDDGASVEFVTPYSGVYFASGGVPQFSALAMTGKLVGSDCRMEVLAGGTATDTAIQSGGSMNVSSGGIADNASVNVGGFLEVSSGATATIRENGGYVDCHADANVTFLENTFSDLVIEGRSFTAHSGTTAVNIEIKGDNAYVYSGGVISKSSIRNYGFIMGGIVLYGGTADDVTVKYGGFLEVSSGGVANNTTLEQGGNASVCYAGVMRNVTVSSGGCLYLYGSSTLTGSMTFEKDAFVSASSYQDGVYLDFDLTIHSPGATALVNNLSAVQGQGVYYTLTVDGTEAEGTYRLADGAAGFDGSISVRNQDNPNLGDLQVGGSVSVNGMCYSLALNGESLTVTVEDQSAGNIFTGALTSATKIIYAGSSAVAVGVYVDGELLISGGEAKNTSIYESGTMEVSGGGTASDTSVLYGGVFSVLDGGTVKTVALDYGAKMTVGSGGAADEVTASGMLYVLAGGSATGVTADADAYLSFEVDPDTYVQGTTCGSSFEIKDGHVSDYTIVNGILDILSGAVADGVTIQDGKMYVSEDGTARDTAVEADGMLLIGYGGKATGSLTIADGAVVSAEPGGIIDFDISERAPGNDALVNDLSLVTGTPAYTLTVSDMQTGGAYTLANGATGFDESITIVDAIGTEYGTLTVGGMAQAAFGIAYTLGLSSGGVLSVTAETVIGPDFFPPELSGITASPSDPTNQNVTVTAEFTDNVEVADIYFRIDDGDWEFYQDGGVVMTKNGTVYFKATDISGNESLGDDFYEVTNIDKVKPTITNIKASTTELVNTNVLVTAVFDDNVGLASKRYRIGDGAWTDYVDGAVVTENNTVSFKAVDAAGNETTEKYEVTNIDKVKPTITGITPSTTEPATSVTVTANFGDDVALASSQYKVGLGDWTDYTTGVTVTENTTVYFKAVDTAGNEATDQYAVTNIETIVPDTTKPIVSNVVASITGPTNQNVTVTAEFSDNVAVASKLYKIGDGAWTLYEDGVTMTENGTVYFKAIDTSSNESDVVNFLVSNIDKVAPAKPTASADITAPTNGSVNVTATFAGDSVKNEYSMDGLNWALYPGVVQFDKNGSVWFRATDEVGNISEVTEYTVGNIDKIPPAKPTASADVTEKTYGSVTVTAVFSGDTAKKEFSLDGLVWQIYTAPIVFNANGKAYFRGTDAAGNVSEINSYDVTNIEPYVPDNKPDDGTNDYLYKKKATPEWNDAGISVSNTITGNGEINLDERGTIDKDGKHNMFGNDGTNKDTGDVAKIDVNTPAKLTITIDSTAAGTFYVYEDGFDKKGKRTQITVAKVTVKAGQTTTLKDVCLTATGKYYVAMTAKNVKKAGTEGLYNVNVTTDKFFADADDNDNNTPKDNFLELVYRDMRSIVMDGAPMFGNTTCTNFVGLGDSVDYIKLDLNSNAFLSFSLTGEGDGKAKFTVWKQAVGTTGKLSKVTSVSLPAKKAYAATTKAQFLDTNKYTYYVSMECTDAAKGKGVYYNVAVTDDSVFFDSADNGRNDVLYDKKGKAFYVEDADHHFETTSIGGGTKAVKLDSDPVEDTNYENFVGYGDPADYAKIELTTSGDLYFKLKATGNATFTVYEKTQDKKGNDTLKAIQTTKLTLAKGKTTVEATTDLIANLAAGEYYVSMTAKSTKANASGSVFYNVSANLNPSVADALAMPETSCADTLADSSLNMTAALSFASLDTDALADISSVSLSELDDKSAWQNLLA